MKYLRNKRLIVFAVAGLMLIGCVKAPGVGGGAIIKGKVTVDDYSASGVYKGSYDAQDYKVFIIYGEDDNIIDDDTRTSFDGTYEFPYLQKGTYKIVVYSNCLTCLGGQDSVLTETVHISDKKQIVEAINFTVRN